MNRVKVDSWAAALAPEQRDELMSAYHASEIGVDAAAERASQLSGRTVSAGAFSNWYRTHRMAWMAQQASIRADMAAREAPKNLDERKSLAIRQAAFAAAVDELSAKEIAALEKNDLTRRKLDLDERRLTLDEAKFADAQRRAEQANKTEDVLKDRELNEAQRQARIREIFGM
jgi:hypothetical protein